MSAADCHCGNPSTHLSLANGQIRCDAHAGEIADAVTMSGFDRDFVGYRLEIEADTNGYTICRLSPPEGRYGGWVQVADLRGSILIYGDLCPGVLTHDNRGVISVEKKSLAWFVGATSTGYLASKFLDTAWQSDAAAAHCRDLAEREEDDDTRAKLEDLADRAESMGEPSDDPSWCDDLGEIDNDALEGCRGYDFANLALLVAIQRRFRLLWLARPVAP